MGRLSGLTIFTLRGVAVTLHVSLLILIAYVLLIANNQFYFVAERSGVNPAEISGSPFTWSVIFAFSLLVSIFLHEFGHVIIAQNHGGTVKQVTLMMLGGVSHIEKTPEEPAVEFKVAIAGPLVSLALAFLLFALRAYSGIPELEFYGFWLGSLNLALAIFNMLPAYPTDGGRVLRAALVSRQGRYRGTRNAIRVSHVFAVFFGVLAILQFNIILALIAVFIYLASKSEMLILTGETVLEGLFVRDVITPAHPLAGASTASEALREMLATRTTILPVAMADASHGLITAEMIQQLPPERRFFTRLDEIAIRPEKFLRAGDPLPHAFTTSLAAGLGALPVVDDNGGLVGLVRTNDILELIRLREIARTPSRQTQLRTREV